MDLSRRFRNEREDLLKELRYRLEEETGSALSGIHNVDRISFRVKGAKSFAAKSLDPTNDPPYTEPLVEIEDQVAGRIIVFFLQDINLVIKRLRGTFNTVESERRRPARDEEFGYESHHLICVVPPHLKPNGWEMRQDLPPTFELQIKTIFMHAYAEPQHDFGYKGAAELPRDIRRELAWIAASAWGADKAYQRVCKWQIANHPDEP